MKQALKHVIILSLLFIVSSLAQATTVRCYFPGYSEAFKDVKLITSISECHADLCFEAGGKKYSVPGNACVVEEDL